MDTFHQKALLVTGDFELLGEIIKHGKFHTIFLNGKATAKEMFKYFGIKLKKVVLFQIMRDGTKRKNMLEGYIAITDKISWVEIGRFKLLGGIHMLNMPVMML